MSGGKTGERTQGKVPFYFKSFDKTIGVASNMEELRSEFKRLLDVDPKSLEYHLKEGGHIVQWLAYIGENELSKRLIDVSDPRKAYEIINDYLSSRKRMNAQEERGGPAMKPHRKPHEKPWHREGGDTVPNDRRPRGFKSKQ